MSEPKLEGIELKPGFKGMAEDTGSDQTMFKGVHWGKAMMWIFLLSDTFIFSCFLIAYMKGRGSTPVEWPPQPRRLRTFRAPSRYARYSRYTQK